MNSVRFLCTALGGLLCSAALAGDFTWKLEGLSGDLEANVKARLAGIPDNITVESRYRSRVRQAAREGLRALGYYRSKFEFSWGEEPEAGLDGKKPPKVLTLKVTPGEPVRIAGTEVILKGEAADDRVFKWLLKKLPKKGDVLNHGVYDDFKNDLLNMGVSRGYFDAKFAKSQLGISVDRNEAYWTIVYESGRRFVFGPVDYSGSQIRESYLQNLVPFKPGDPYRAEDVAELNSRLSAVGWFNSIMVAPDFANVKVVEESKDAVEVAEAPKASGTSASPAASSSGDAAGTEKTTETAAEDLGPRKSVPITAAVTPKRGNSMEVGLGYSTDVGPRFKSIWVKPWMNDRGHSLTTNLAVSAYEQEFDTVYKIPVEENPLEEYWLVQGGYKHTDLNDTKSNSMTLVGSRYWNMETGWQRAVNLRWSLDKFTQGADDNTTMLVYPGVSFSRTRTRGGLMPFWGDMQRYTVDVSSTYWGSDIDFIVFNAQGAIVRTWARKHRFVARGNFGWMQTNDFDEVPPDLRFFAGGDRSIRGYDYKSVSPKDETGDLVGAQRLLTGSLEYQYNVTGKWWGAVFVDSGEAVEKFSDTNFKTGVGVGVRWASPVGPVKLDIAVPVGDPDHKGVQFYIGLGPEL